MKSNMEVCFGKAGVVRFRVAGEDSRVKAFWVTSSDSGVQHSFNSREQASCIVPLVLMDT